MFSDSSLSPTQTTACENFRLLRLVFFSTLLVVAMVAPMNVWADVTGEGDVTPSADPDLPEFGGIASGLITVGDTGIGLLTVDVPSITDPLESEGGIIGNTATGIGVATISGFVGDQSAWLITVDDLVVGAEGQAYLNVTGGGLVSVDNTADLIFAQSFRSQAIVAVNGFASQLLADDLIIGVEGFADVTVANQALLRSNITVLGDMPNSNVNLTITGLGTRWFNAGSTLNDLVVAHEGRATLEVLDQAQAFAVEDVVVGADAGSHGTVRIQGDGSIWLIDDDLGTGGEDLAIGSTGGIGEVFVTDHGQLQVSGTTTVGVTSFVDLETHSILRSGNVVLDGALRGRGRVESSVTINGTGELRNYGDTPVYTPEEVLLVTGPVTNGGTIEAMGGEMEFESAVVNNFEVVARDTVMRFLAGLTNNGSLSIGGDTTLHGDITGSGDIFVLADSESLLVGDLTFSASSIVSLTAGPADGTLDVSGMIDLASAILELDYSAGVFPQAGDTYEILDSTNAIVGTFANALDQVTDGNLNIWDIIYNSNSVYVTATGVEVVPPSGDFDSDLDVDGSDFLAWQRGFMTLPSNYDATDLVNWQAQYGTGALASAAVSAVPEPSALLLASLAVGCCSHRRRYS